MSKSSPTDWRTPTVVLVCGGIILTVAHGHSPRLRPLPAADFARHGLGPRDVRAGDRRAESRVGRDAAVRRNDLRQVRRRARRDGGCGAVCARPGRDGERAHAIGVRPDLRRPDRRRPLRRHVQRHLRRARSPLSAGKAEHGARHLGRRRIVRPVRDAAVDAVAALPCRLVRRTAGHGVRRAVHGAAGGGPRRAQGRAAPRVRPVGRTGDARGAGAPRLHAAHGRLLRLRLPGRVPRRAPARLPRRTRACRRTSR